MAKKARKKAKPREAADAPLSPQQDLFCREYLAQSLNATKAAIAAGYSEKTAAQSASRLLRFVNIQNRIAQLGEERNKRLEVDADKVLQRWLEEWNADLLDIHNDDGTLKDMKDWPLAWRRGLVAGVEAQALYAGKGSERQQVGVMTKLKLADRHKKGESIAKHVSVQAYRKVAAKTTSDPLQELYSRVKGRAIVPRAATPALPAPPAAGPIIEGKAIRPK